MVNIDKVVNDIKNDGKYDAILEIVKNKLNNENPSFNEIKKLVNDDSFYIAEYKDLNRWGELSSVHLKELEIDKDDASEVKKLKKEINEKYTYLVNSEEYEIKQKNLIYFAWTVSIALPSIYIIDNLVRITGLYEGNENGIYISFILVLILSMWGYIRAVKNHKQQNKKYIQIQTDTKALIKNGLDKKAFTAEEIYLF